MDNGLVYSYMRFSDPKQAAGDSRTRQWVYAAKWAAERGLRLDENLSMQDEGLSAYHQHHVKRGALGAFLAAVEAGLVPRGSFLIVEGLDRLSRAEPILAQAQLAQIINAGISVVTASDSKVYSRETLKANPMDLVYSLLVMIRAHEESETKSTRVKAAIRRQCEGWQAGTYRGVIRNGTDPSWVRLVDGKWELIEERAAVVRTILSWYLDGRGVIRIVRDLLDAGLTYTGRAPNTLNIHRLVRLQALMGHRELEVDGQGYVLQGYYPALISHDEWLEVQSVANRRGLRPVRGGDMPGLLTGLNIAVCGYCGNAMIGQNMRDRRDAGGAMPDYARRLACSRHRKFRDCADGAARSVVPLEKALVSYCSDLMNLQALQGADRSTAPRAKLAAAIAALAEIERKEQRLMAALLDSDDTPTLFVAQAHQLQDEKARAQAAVQTAEQEVAATSRRDLGDADEKWRLLAAGVLAMDIDARTRGRQLVSDTFESITIWLKGVRPDETPADTVDVLLKAKGGSARSLRVSKDGSWIAGESVTSNAV